MIRKTMLSVIELSKQVLFAWTLSAICVATFTACDSGSSYDEERKNQQEQAEQEYQERIDKAVALLGQPRTDFTSEQLLQGEYYSLFSALRVKDNHVVVMLLNADGTHIEFLNEECVLESTKQGKPFHHVACEMYLLGEDGNLYPGDRQMVDNTFAIKMCVMYDDGGGWDSYVWLHDSNSSSITKFTDANNFSIFKGYQDAWLLNVDYYREEDFHCHCYRTSGELLFRASEGPLTGGSIPVSYISYTQILVDKSNNAISLYNLDVLPELGATKRIWNEVWSSRVVESECDVIGYTVEDRSSNVWTFTCRYKRPVTNGDEVFTCRFLLNIETGEVVML